MDTMAEHLRLPAHERLAAISRQIWSDKYRFKDGDGTPVDQTVEDTWRRIARALAAVEKQPEMWEGRFYQALEDFKFLPAGRIVAVANSLPNIAFVASQKPDTFEVVLPTFGTKAYFGFIGTKKPEDAALLDAVQAALVKIKADGRMTTAQEKWFGATFETPNEVPEPAL
jgi:polar amino acid transport system substrate-binding protein